jgi:hypothetical protein
MLVQRRGGTIFLWTAVSALVEKHNGRYRNEKSTFADAFLVAG